MALHLENRWHARRLRLYHRRCGETAGEPIWTTRASGWYIKIKRPSPSCRSWCRRRLPLVSSSCIIGGCRRCVPDSGWAGLLVLLGWSGAGGRLRLHRARFLSLLPATVQGAYSMSASWNMRPSRRCRVVPADQGGIIRLQLPAIQSPPSGLAKANYTTHSRRGQRLRQVRAVIHGHPALEGATTHEARRYSSMQAKV